MATEGGSAKVERFWQGYLDSREEGKAVPESYEIWHFGSTEQGARNLALLIRDGQKTATSALVWELDVKGFRLPNVGDVAVVADLDGNPYCIIEVTEVEVIPFGQISDEQFVIDYGEGATSLSQWKGWSWVTYTEVCREIGREPSDRMPIACQRFRLLYAGQPESAK